MKKITLFLDKLQDVKSVGSGRWKAKCPAHADHTPSLSLKETSNGDVLLHCFVGCQFGDIIAALDMRASDCFADSKQSTPSYRRRHRVHEIEAEFAVLRTRYGFSAPTARALVHAGLKRHMEGLA